MFESTNVPNKENKFNEKAFIETIKYLKSDRKREGYYLLNNPHLLYLTEQQTSNYLKAIGSEKYAKAVHNPAVNIIQDNIEVIFGLENKEISLIELGPGYPDISLPIAKYCQKHSMSINYYPVDVSDQYLQLASQEMRPYVKTAFPIQAKFEDCLSEIPHEVYSKPVYVLIGLTFMNFKLVSFLNLLKRVAGEAGRIIVSAELITHNNTITRILKNYDNTRAAEFTFGPLFNLGIPFDSVDYFVDFHDSRIEATFVSYRYTLDMLQNHLDQYFSKIQMFFSKDKNTIVALLNDVVSSK